MSYIKTFMISLVRVSFVALLILTTALSSKPKFELRSIGRDFLIGFISIIIIDFLFSLLTGTGIKHKKRKKV